MTQEQAKEIIDFGIVRTTESVTGSGRVLSRFVYINNEKVDIDFKEYERLFQALEFVGEAQRWISAGKGDLLSEGYYNEFVFAKNYLEKLKG